MKKLLSLVLALTLALGMLACAEDLPYLHQLYTEHYSRVLALPEELVPTVWLTNNSSSLLFWDDYYTKSTYLTFRSPAGMMCNEFQPNYISFINDDKIIQYTYQAMDEYSYERLLNKCSDDKYVLYDGSDGIAAYVDPEYGEVEAVIKLGGISKNAKLLVRLIYNFARTDTEASRVSVLTAAAKKELPRVQSQIQYHAMSAVSDYWTYNAFAGILSPSLEFGDFGIHFDLSTKISRKLGFITQTAPLFVAEMDDYKFTLYAVFAEKASARIVISAETYSAINYVKRDTPDEVFILTDEAGNLFECYTRGYKNTSGKTEYSHLQTSLLLSDKAGYSSDKNYYLNIDFDLNGYKFSSDEATRKSEASKLLNEIMSGIRSFNPENITYVPSGNAVQPQDEPAPEATAFRNGIRWGASQQEVLAGENASAFRGDVRLYGQFADVSQVYAKTVDTKLSKYSARAIYYFVDDGVQLADIYLNDEDGSAAKYLTGAFTKVYGEAKQNPQTDPVLAKATEAMGMASQYSQPIAGWQPADDLAIQMFKTGSVLEILYVNSAYDIDTLIANLEPDYDLSGL